MPELGGDLVRRTPDDEVVDQLRAHPTVREKGIAGVGEHTRVERGGGIVAELLPGFAVDLVPVRANHHRYVNHQPRPVPTGAVSSFLQGGHRDLLNVGRGAVPAHCTVGQATRGPEGGSAQRGYWHGSAGSMREAGVRSIELTLEMDGPGLQRGLHDAEILDQAAEGTIEADVVDRSEEHTSELQSRQYFV